MKKLTVREYAQKLQRSERTIRKWIEDGKLRTRTELINGRKVTVIFVDDEEFDPESNTEYAELAEDTIFGKEPTNAEQMPNQLNHNIQADILEVIKQMQEQNAELIKDVKIYAELAGQTKLLTDSESKTKEEYFRLQQELAEVKAELKMKNQRIEELELLLAQKKNMNVWFKNRKL
ncbi:MAG: hypothetical protein AB1782_12285 [Cyanobacteriota bacterium]